MKTLPDLITRWEELKVKFELFVLIDRYNKFIRFLKRKPELWMFIPCGKDGLPLKRPDGMNESSFENFQDKCEYQEAKARCLFSGLKCGDYYSGEGGLCYELNQDIFFLNGVCYYNYKPISKIADLCNKVQLTPEGEKQAGII